MIFNDGYLLNNNFNKKIKFGIYIKMAKKKNVPVNLENDSSLFSKNSQLKKQEKWTKNFAADDPLVNDERDELAKKLNINLVRPKQSNRIKALFEIYEKYLAKSKVNCFLYSSIIENANKLIEIYKRQKSEIHKLETVNENNEFLKQRLAYVVNRYRAKIETLKCEIEKSRNLLIDHNKRKINVAELLPDSKEELIRLDGVAWSNYLKTFEINKELRNTIIGYENRLCLFKVNKLFLDYKLFVNQEINRYREKLKELNRENDYEINETLRYFDLPVEKLDQFKNFLKAKLESKLIDSQNLKSSFGKFYDFDVAQIDRMVAEVRKQHDDDLQDIVGVINHYKRLLLKKQTKAKNDLDELILYTKKRYDEKIVQLEASLKFYQDVYSSKQYLTQDEIDLLLELNRNELVVHVEKLKLHYTNKIKPLTDDFDNMEKLIERDYVFDKRRLKEKIAEMKSLENENLLKWSDEFQADKDKLVKLYDRKYAFIKSDLEFVANEFGETIEKLRKDTEEICANILEHHQQYWTLANLEFNSEARKFLTKFHYENAPWTHLWRDNQRAWMHDYLLINLSSEYLNHVGESLRSFSPESQLYINISKALTQFNEKSRELFKVRDEIEFEQLIRLNTVPAVETTTLKQNFNEVLIVLKNEEINLEKALKNFVASPKLK